jgi:hypothetical protein
MSAAAAARPPATAAAENESLTRSRANGGFTPPVEKQQRGVPAPSDAPGRPAAWNSTARVALLRLPEAVA